jgi:Transmembrane amino acid transporter protein
VCRATTQLLTKSYCGRLSFHRCKSVARYFRSCCGILLGAPDNRSKFGLVIRPLNVTLETTLGLDNPRPQATSGNNQLPPTKLTTTTPKFLQTETFRKTGIAIERTVFALLAVLISIIVPEFGSMIGFLGAFSVFLLCVIGPVSAKIAIRVGVGRGMLRCLWSLPLWRFGGRFRFCRMLTLE